MKRPPQAKNGASLIPYSHIYLPSTLFKDAKEGATIQFYFDNRLIKLTCKESLHPVNQSKKFFPFETQIKALKQKIQYEHTQALFSEDSENDLTFNSEIMGQENTRMLLSDLDKKESLTDFKKYENDQNEHGLYKTLKTLEYSSSLNIFYIDGVTSEDIHIIESRGFHGFRKLLIVIPHKPTLNVCSFRSQWTSETGQIFTLSKGSFDPKHGDRVFGYRHGQYFITTLSENDTYQLSIESGNLLYLTINHT